MSMLVPKNTRQLLDEWATESTVQMYYDYNAKEETLTVYSARIGAVIGKAGLTVEKFTNLIKKQGVAKVRLVELFDAKIPNYNEYDDSDDEYDWD